MLSSFYRYRAPVLLLSLWLAAVLLFSHRPAHSTIKDASNLVNPLLALVSKKTITNSVTPNISTKILENGLTVLTKEVHTAPVVTVQVWYKVGSRHEKPGVNGIAHQLEHMMFKGTQGRPVQFGRLFSALGSDSNAFTSYDQTAYYGTAERHKLKALLELEADRMQNAKIDVEQLESEKRVVISELQGYENNPEYRLNRAVMKSVFPNHSYGLPVGGTAADVEKFTVEKVQKYYREFYNPNNAVLAIVGDINTEKTLKIVEELFGKIPKIEGSIEGLVEGSIEGSTLDSQKSVISLNSNSALSTPIVLREAGSSAILQVVYPLEDINHPDVPTLDVLDYVLTGGRNSRLEQALVESGLAIDVSASVDTLEKGGWYDLVVTADATQDLNKINSVVQTTIAKLLKKGVTLEEVNRAKRQLEASLILGNRDITSQGMQLANDLLITGEYNYTDKFLANVRKVTPADVSVVAQKYLTPDKRTVGYFQPTQAQGANQSVNFSGAVKSTQTTEHFYANTPLEADKLAKYLPHVEEEKIKDSHTLPKELVLANGLKVLLLPDKSTPTVTLSGYMKAGSEFDPETQAGLASVVAESLLNGTKSKNALLIAKILDDKGASLDFQTYREGVYVHGSSLAGDLNVVLETLADAVKNPNFPKKELELTLQQAITSLRQDLDDPSEVARRTFVQSVYPKKHPLHNFPTEESLRGINRQDVIAFKAKYYRPDTTTLALVGNFDPEKVSSYLEKEFSDWHVQGQAPKLEYPVVLMPDKPVHHNSSLPGKAQAITYMGYTAINRQDPRYYAAVVLNQIVGGDTLSSRLGSELRDRQGLTYGIYSNFLAGKSTGQFFIEMQTNPEDANKAINKTCQLLNEVIQKGVSSEEVETAKQTLISNYIVSLANPDELIHKILMNKVYGLNPNELSNLTEKIDKVSLAEVNQAARELIHPDKIVVVTAGPPVLAHDSGR